nr:uncharacterized protein LOC109757233 [Aegilops tauschii subsp. strangulata]
MEAFAGAPGAVGGDSAPGLAPGDLGSGAQALEGGWSVAVSPAARRAAVPSQGAAKWSGSRFWVLADEVSDGEEEVEACDEAGSGAGGRAACSIGDFVSRAEELGGSFKAGCRRAFAPGGHGPRWAALPGGRVPCASPRGEGRGSPEASDAGLLLQPAQPLRCPVRAAPAATVVAPADPGGAQARVGDVSPGALAGQAHRVASGPSPGQTRAAA